MILEGREVQCLVILEGREVQCLVVLEGREGQCLVILEGDPRLDLCAVHSQLPRPSTCRSHKTVWGENYDLGWKVS